MRIFGRKKPRAHAVERSPTSQALDQELARLLSEQHAVEAAGQVNGRHISTYVDEIAALKRENRLDEAEALLIKLVAAAASESKRAGWGLPAPHYTLELAIIYRKQHRYTDEVRVLEEYLANLSPRNRRDSTGIKSRLEKARALAAKAQSA